MVKYQSKIDKVKLDKLQRQQQSQQRLSNHTVATGKTVTETDVADLKSVDTANSQERRH